MAGPNAVRVAAKLQDKARETVTDLVNLLTLIKSPPALSAVVMDEVARLAAEMAVYYREKEHAS